MPRTKLQPLTPEQLDRDCWRRVNREVKKAMADAGIRSVSALAEVTGISEKTLHNRFEMQRPWKLTELWRVANAVNMTGEAMNRIFKRKEKSA